MSWLHEQFQAWQEICAGLTFLILGLLLEFAIDVWRERVIKKRRHYHVIQDDSNANDWHVPGTD